MSNDRQKKIEEIFHQATGLKGKHRDLFIAENCCDDLMRHEVEKLLQYDHRYGGGLTEPVQDPFISRGETEKNGSTGDQQKQSLDSSSSGGIDHGRFLPGTILADRYRIVGMLGKGGMGEVFRADDLELGQSVALKFLPKRLADDAQSLEGFRSEVRLARQVSHPNVCRVYDIGQIEGQWFLSMEYVDGEDLGLLLQRIGRFNSDRAIELARQLCLGLQAAHEKGVIHRDLKPANVMIDGRGKLLISDFGLAEIPDNIRDEDIRSGTPAYMSPEQLEGREVTKLSDIYSLGLILYELFTGQPFWNANSMLELLEQRNSNSPNTFLQQLTDLDPEVETTMTRCLDPNPLNRPASALEVIATLPGGDPLTAVLGAGETPTPEMVAAAGDNIKLDRKPAVIGLLAVIIGLVLVVLLEDLTSPVSRSHLELEPPVLRDRIKNMLIEFGYDEQKTDDIQGFRWFPKVADEPISYWYRQRILDDQRARFGVTSFWSSNWGQVSWARPDFFQPPEVQPGEVNVIMSGDTRLNYLRIRPKYCGHSLTPQPKPQWEKWFSPKRTGFRLLPESSSQNNLATPDGEYPQLQIASDLIWTPPDAYDDIRVWKGKNSDGSPVTVQAAAWQGKPIYFRVLSEIGDSDPVPTIFDSARTRKQTPYVVTVIMAAMIFGLIIAWHNLRNERVDWEGGRRLAVYVAFINFIILLSLGRFTSSPQDIYSSLICLGFGLVIFEVARIWVWYMALEPYIRKVWPQVLITSSRLLERRNLDPLVGRDILAGTVAAILMMIVYKVNIGIHLLLGLEINIPAILIPTPLIETREFVGRLFASHGFAFFVSVFIVMVLLMARIAGQTEKRGLMGAVVILTPLITVVMGGNIAISLLAAFVVSIMLIYLLVRFGILALLTAYTFRVLLATVPLTFDFEKWYFGSGIAAITFFLVTTWIGFSLAVRVKRNQASPLR